MWGQDRAEPARLFRTDAAPFRLEAFLQSAGVTGEELFAKLSEVASQDTEGFL